MWLFQMTSDSNKLAWKISNLFVIQEEEKNDKGPDSCDRRPRPLPIPLSFTVISLGYVQLCRIAESREVGCMMGAQKPLTTHPPQKIADIRKLENRTPQIS